MKGIEYVTPERKNLEPLNENELIMAQKMVDLEHPLKDTFIWVTLPFLKPVKKYMPGYVPEIDQNLDISFNLLDSS